LTFPTHIVAACGLVSRPDGAVLLVQTHNRGWVCPGGQIEEGESLVDGLVREIREESGVDARVHTLVGICSNVRPPTKVIFSFLADWISGDLSVSVETTGVRWVPRADVLAMFTHRSERDRAREMLEFTGAITYRVVETRPYAVHFAGPFSSLAAQLVAAPGRPPSEDGE